MNAIPGPIIVLTRNCLQTVERSERQSCLFILSLISIEIEVNQKMWFTSILLLGPGTNIIKDLISFRNYESSP